jgi:type III secretory pathway component EscS
MLIELAAIKAADLVRANELGPVLNFESGLTFFSRTLRLFHALNEANLDDISYQKLVQVRDRGNEALSVFNNIKGFSLTKYPSNPIQMRDQFINQVRDQYDSNFETVAPIVAFTVRKGTDFEKLEEQAKAALKRIDVASESHETALKEARNNAEQLVEEVRRIAAESGVAMHAIHFKDESDRHEASAKSWLKATIWLAVGTIVAAIVLLIVYFKNLITLAPAQSLQVVISKIIIFSVLLSATLWAGKTYRAHRHNAVVNRHRQNALATFQAFAKAASDDQTKNAVLLQATQCIFSAQPTGYITGESDAAGIPQVLEIVRDLGKAK